MNSSESISLLNKLILPNVELNRFQDSRHYLKWFMEKSYSFFTTEEQFDFTNIQYYLFGNHSSKDFINGRLTGIPCLFNTKGLSKDRSLQLRYDILAFVVAIGIVEKKPFQGFISSFETFKDKFIIEVIRVVKDVQIKEPIIFNPLSKMLTIYIPDLYDKEFSIKHFGHLKHDLPKISGNKIGEDGLITGGEMFESFVFDFFTSERAKLFASEVIQFFNVEKVKYLINDYKIHLAKILNEMGINTDQDLTDQFIKVSFLHAWLKSVKCSYQISLSELGNNSNLTSIGVFLVTSHKRLNIDKLNLLHIALNSAFNSLNNIYSCRNENVSSIVTKENKNKYPKITSDIKVTGTQSKQKAFKNFEKYGIIANSPCMFDVLKKVEKVSRFDTDVLLLGESGTGKELIARAIHELSSRKEGPYLTVSMAERPHSILDSELFGYEKGAFTGADNTKKGYFERADGGTLFLDELSHIPFDDQAKLLRVLQSRTFERVGGKKEIKVDVRVISATSENIQEYETRQRLHFLDPLYFRLEKYIITVPPLRERKEEIPLLAKYYLNHLSPQKKVMIDEKCFDLLKESDWPGNIRQLFGMIERAYINAYDEDKIKIKHFEFDSSYNQSDTNKHITHSEENSKKYKVQELKFKKNYYKNLLQKTNGNIPEAAKIAGVSRQALYNIIKELGI